MEKIWGNLIFIQNSTTKIIFHEYKGSKTEIVQYIVSMILQHIESNVVLPCPFQNI